VQSSKSPENKQPIEKRADGKRSHSMASHSSVKSLKSRVISIGSPKKAKLTPASKPASDTSPDLQLTPASKPASDSSSDLQLTPAEFFAKENDLARKIKESDESRLDREFGAPDDNDESRLDRELAALTQGLDDEELLLSFDPERVMPGQHRIIQRGLPRRPKPLSKLPNSTSPERRGPVGRTVPTKPPETRGGDGK
jgi:hypothetical protein